VSLPVVTSTSNPAGSSAALTTAQVWRFVPARRLLVANFVLFAGISLQAAALGKQVFDITGREIDLGFIGLAEFLPTALLVLVTGPLADRLNRKRIVVATVAVEVAATVALIAYTLSGRTEVWPFFVIAVAYGIGRAFQAPALRAMPPMVAPEGGLPKVIAMFSATWTVAGILGPALSGFLYAIDPWVAYAGSTVLLLIGWFSVALVRFERQPRPADVSERPTLRAAVEGLRFIRRTPVLFAAISLDLFAVLFGGAVALLPVIAEEQLRVGDVAYGWLRAAPGIGAGLMAVLLAVKPIRRRVGKLLFVAVAVFGAATVVLGVTRSYAIAFAALLVLSAADMISVFIRSSLVPLVTPDEKRGRVLAVENVFIGASNELGAFESGVVAQAVGTPATVIGGGVATLVVVGTWALAFPSLRRVDSFDELDQTRQIAEATSPSS
jgi:MFS family permease